MPKKFVVEITAVEASVIEQLADGAWKTGGVRSPADAAVLDGLRSKVHAAVSAPVEVKEVKK